MYRASSSALLIACITSLPSTASEIGILIDTQFSQSVPYSDFRASAIRANGFGIRGAYTLLDLKAAELGITATYHPSVKANSNFFAGSNSLPLGSSKFRNKYAAVGLQANWKFLVDLHLGMEARQETVSFENGPLTVSSSVSPQSALLHAESGETTFVRPWATAGLGFSIPSPVVTPFVRIEIAYSLKTYSTLSPYLSANGDDFRKRFAPNYQVALYGGIRF